MRTIGWAITQCWPNVAFCRLQNTIDYLASRVALLWVAPAAAAN